MSSSFLQIHEEVDSINIELLTMYAAQTNSPATELYGAVDASSTTIFVKDGSVLPPRVPYLLTLGFDASSSETVLVTAQNGDELTVIRGVDGDALAWVADTKCARMFTAKDLNDVQANLASLGDGVDDARIAVDLLITELCHKEADWGGRLSDLESSDTSQGSRISALETDNTAYKSNIAKLTARTDIVAGTVTLTNSQKFPFNDSQVTVPISVERNNTNYIVDYEVSAASGNVGDVIVSAKLVNGFKIEFTGSATSVTIKYQVLGGMN